MVLVSPQGWVDSLFTLMVRKVFTQLFKFNTKHKMLAINCS